MTTTREYNKVYRELRNWIDTTVIARNIVEALEATNQPVTFENGKKVWLDELENMNLADNIRNSPELEGEL